MRQQFMYPQQMRWPGQQMMPRPKSYQPVPGNYMMQGGAQQQRGQQGGRGGRNMQQQRGQRQQGQQGRPQQMMQQQQRAQAPVQVPQAMPRAAEPLTLERLASAPPEQQKQILGERLFPMIHSSYPQHAGKITGMLLEMDNSELLNLLESPEALQAKVMEALAVLNEVSEGGEAAQ